MQRIRKEEKKEEDGECSWKSESEWEIAEIGGGKWQFPSIFLSGKEKPSQSPTDSLSGNITWDWRRRGNK